MMAGGSTDCWAPAEFLVLLVWGGAWEFVFLTSCQGCCLCWCGNHTLEPMGFQDGSLFWDTLRGLMNTHSERRSSPPAPRAPTPHCEPPRQESSHPQIGLSPIHFELRARAVHAATPNPREQVLTGSAPVFLSARTSHIIYGAQCVC